MIESRLIWSSSSLGLAFLLAGLNLFAQTPAASQTAPNVLALRAELVLSQEFCATKKRQSIAIKDVLNVGKAACAQLYEALVPIFTDLKRIEKKSPPGNSSAQITLIPRFADISATQQPFLPSSRRKLGRFRIRRVTQSGCKRSKGRLSTKPVGSSLRNAWTGWLTPWLVTWRRIR